MTNEVITQLEEKVQHAIDVIKLYHSDIEHLKHETTLLETQLEQLRSDHASLTEQNLELQQIQELWESKTNALIQKLNEVTELDIIKEEEMA